MEEEGLTTSELITKYVKPKQATSLSLSKYIVAGQKLLDVAVSGKLDTIERPHDVH